jgi:hypothetical protein
LSARATGVAFASRPRYGVSQLVLNDASLKDFGSCGGNFRESSPRDPASYFTGTIICFPAPEVLVLAYLI